MFTLRDIPGVMRRNGLPIGARLMERWFAGPARAMTPAEKAGDILAVNVNPQFVDARSVTMAWTLRHARARVAADRLLRTWTVGQRRTASAARIAAIVRADAARTRRSGNYRFGDLGRPVTEIDSYYQVNREVVESAYYGDVDDFYAALGAALVKLAISGEVSSVSPGRVRIVVDQVGLYLRDTYDFIGDQPLGAWSEAGISRVAVLAPDIPVTEREARDGDWLGGNDGQRYYSVGNRSFRRYRELVGQGGDFLVFTDVQRQPLNPPFVTEFEL